MSHQCMFLVHSRSICLHNCVESTVPRCKKGLRPASSEGCDDVQPSPSIKSSEEAHIAVAEDLLQVFCEVNLRACHAQLYFQCMQGGHLPHIVLYVGVDITVRGMTVRGLHLQHEGLASQCLHKDPPGRDAIPAPGAMWPPSGCCSQPACGRLLAACQQRGGDAGQNNCL